MTRPLVRGLGCWVARRRRAMRLLGAFLGLRSNNLPSNRHAAAARRRLGAFFGLRPNNLPTAAGAVAVGALLLAGCGSGSDTAHHPAHPGAALNGAEPAVAPPLTRAPAGRVVSVGAAAEGIVAAPRAGLVAVAVRDPDRIVELSTRTGAVEREVRIAGPARHLALDGGATLLVPEAPIDRLLELPLTHERPGAARSIRTGSLPHDAAALDGRVFVADEFGHAISVLRGDRQVATVPGFTQPGGIATVGERVALVDVAADTVTLVDPRTLRRTGVVIAGAGPTHDVAGPDDRLYVTDTRGDALYVFATRPRLRRLALLPLPARPYGIAADPRRDRLYVTETGRNRLVELDTRGPHARIVATYPTVRQPNTVAVDPRTGTVYVAGAASGVVEELHPAS